jgi:class 3 adenylate cyclase/alpha-beta hydrolase superfamily lysophospholipase
MQPPPVQYCTTSDGIRIAYTVSGSGQPLVFMTETVVSHTQLEWSHPVFGALVRRLAERLTLIRFDARGSGLSDRVRAPGPDENLYASLDDLEAVTQKIGIDRFGLCSIQIAAMGAIRYAASNPHRVSRLVLSDPAVRGTDFLTTKQGQALAAAFVADFVVGTEAIGAAAFGVGRDENRDYGAYIRNCVGEDVLAAISNLLLVDASSFLPDVQQPTLILKHAGLAYISEEASKEAASRIPNAQLHIVAGAWADDIVSVADRIADFVLEESSPTDSAAPPRSHPEESGVRTILFTDIEGHTAMMQRLGDDRGRALLREHERITREVIARHSGSEIKTIGDAFMVSFGSVASAAQCAVELQQAFAGASLKEALRIRVGLNAGEPIAEQGDLFGSSVILASRIVGQAQGGEILVSEVVRGLLAGKPFLFNDRGETALRGFEDPVRLYELRWTDDRRA